jgi:recombination protein RecA
VVKNKVAPPFKLAEFDIMYNEGISKEGGLLDLGVELAIVRKSGAFFSYGDSRLGQGRENAKEYLRKNVELRDEIERQIRGQTLTSRVVVTTPVAAENGVAAADELVDAF